MNGESSLRDMNVLQRKNFVPLNSIKQIHKLVHWTLTAAANSICLPSQP